jgi:hypothetical protein
MYKTRIFGIAAKIETTSGTDAVPTAAANSIRVVGVPTLAIGYLESGERNDVVTGQLGRPDRTAPAGRFASIDITVEIKGSGTAGTPPEYGVLMRMSGHSETISAGVSVTYTTIDDGMETGTLYCWSAGKLYKLVGCVATMKASAAAAKRGFKTFSVKGKLASDPIQQALPAQTFLSVLPPLFHSSTANIGSWLSTAASDPLVLESVEIDEQIQIVERPSAGATDGLISYLISDRAVKQTMVIEVPAIASFDADAVAKASGATAPTSGWQIGTVAGNKMQVQTGRWSIVSPSQGDNNGLVTQTLTGGLGIGSAPTTNREINYIYT